MTNDGPVYHALSVQLRRAKSIAHFDNQYDRAKISESGVWYKVPEESTLIFRDT